MKPSKLFAFTLGTLSAIGGFIDIGDLVADAQVGARFGLRLAWVTVLSVVGIACYAEMSARIIRTRRPALDLIRSRMGPRFALLALLGAFAVTGLLVMAELSGVAFALQANHRGEVLGLDLTQARVVLGDQSYRLGVDNVGLAALSRRKQSGPGGQRGGDVENVLATGQQALRNAHTQAGCSLDSPSPIRPRLSEDEQLAQGACIHQQPCGGQDGSVRARRGRG